MRIAVLGDAMLDIDFHCEVVKRYGDAPVLRELSQTSRPGGAANVAEMITALGGEVLLMSDEDSQTIKRRFLVDGALVARHDTETIRQAKVTNLQKALLEEFDPAAIVIADHGKGFITEELIQSLPDVPLFIDPVATTPTSREAIWIGGESEIPPDATGKKIIKKGAFGLTFEGVNVPSMCRDCVDDIGAGDQFLASFSVSMLRGSGGIWDAIHVANADAGEQCRRLGIVPIIRRF